MLAAGTSNNQIGNVNYTRIINLIADNSVYWEWYNSRRVRISTIQNFSKTETSGRFKQKSARSIEGTEVSTKPL